MMPSGCLAGDVFQAWPSGRRRRGRPRTHWRDYISIAIDHFVQQHHTGQEDDKELDKDSLHWGALVPYVTHH